MLQVLRIHLAACRFTTDYYDLERREFVNFKCEEESTGRGLCIFHDKQLNREQSQLASKRLMEKINESIEHNKTLRCIGYYLPDIEVISKNFKKPVQFYKSMFQRVDFSGSTFSAEADFSACNFSHRVYFSGVSFFKLANFSQSTFSAEADFSACKFTSETDFSRTIFSGRIDFFSCTFHDKSYFSGAKFSYTSNFDNSKFDSEANFIFSLFYNTASFSKCVFNSQITFFDAKFYGEVFFADAILAEANFIGAKFSSSADFSAQFEREPRFNYVLFEEQDQILFDVEKLSISSFANTDITRVRFTDTVIWEEEIRYHPEQLGLNSLVAVYRNLRENYEYRYRYDEAAIFFLREMELKRKYREVHFESGLETRMNNYFTRNFSFIAWYYHLSRYGHDLLRPILFGIFLIALSTFYWWNQLSFDLSNLSLVKPALERSISSFLPFVPVENATLEDYLMKSLGVIILGLFFIALRRKFERKFIR